MIVDVDGATESEKNKHRAYWFHSWNPLQFAVCDFETEICIFMNEMERSGNPLYR